MKTKKYFIIPMLALLAYGCQDDEKSTIQPAVGEEVKFGATLHDGVSKTIYGPEANNAFPIYWVNGDEVIVSSPQCANQGGVGSATYKVSVDGASQNYATSLDKTGEIGLRWGDNLTGDFYSIYPASRSVLGGDYKTVTITMPAQQDNNFTETNGTKSVINPDMRGCFMYANTTGVQSGQTVNLRYKPLSTAVRFSLQGPSSGEVGINYIRLFAPAGTNINGTYEVDLSTATEDGLPTMRATRGLNYVTSNVANAENNEYLTLSTGEYYEVNLFLLLGQETEITDEWYVEIGTTSGVSFRKYLDGTANGGKNKTLVPGKIHRLPNMPPLEAQQLEWDPAHWMANLQRNVYLSEISIPGSWNSLNHDYQEPYAIQGQYDAGVRAFHLDTRWRATSNWYGVVGNSPITDLGIANGGKTYDVHGDDDNTGKCMRQDAPRFTDALTQITDNVKDDEYMVVICTFAQGSTQHGDWRQAISEACAANDKVIDASTLTPETVVNDVLGKVIVIVNTYTEGEVSGSKCFFFNMGMTLSENDWTDLTNSETYYKVPLTWHNTTPSGITVYGTHAQITTDENSYNDNDRGWVPSYSDREQMITNILNWSKNNYSDMENYAHDAWIYLGLGGYIPGTGGLFGTDDDPTSVGEHFGNWFSNIVNDMDTNNSYYPIGIVLINHANTYSQLVNNILMMNNKYRKAYDPDRSPVDGSDITRSTVQSAAPGYSSGMTDSGTDAIGWVRSR